VRDQLCWLIRHRKGPVFFCCFLIEPARTWLYKSDRDRFPFK
jgi:hypothetical protein